ncbi:choloylglycine hydrolase [uncultured Lactobacillus sp.]|uniref:choloylglycine hydrolase n=1 Tax=uncultured Lactobacillus sp. TaxID=153152 RepID=UPI002603CADB|nr:choloylglycine hydrolase [uncultured Lactobacillus sp.]
MCTSIIYSSNNHYFGRNLDLEVTFGQKVVVMPRNYKIKMKRVNDIENHYAIVGMAAVEDGFPLFFDAANEKGLGMAGLAYADRATYMPAKEDKKNIASFELIPYILGQCENIAQVKELLDDINVDDDQFSKQFPPSPLHWLLADKTGASLTLEPDKDGLHYYDNPVGVLTNVPEFPKQLINLSNYATVSPAQPKNTLVPNTDIDLYSRGMGTHFLPGGMDSESRFVKVAFTLQHAPKGKDNIEDITNYFHIMQAIAQPKGLDEVAPNTFEYTIYTDCTDLEHGVYYYTTYENNQITAIDMNKTDLDGSVLTTYQARQKQEIAYEN